MCMALTLQPLLLRGAPLVEKGTIVVLRCQCLSDGKRSWFVSQPFATALERAVSETPFFCLCSAAEPDRHPTSCARLCAGAVFLALALVPAPTWSS